MTDATQHDDDSTDNEDFDEEPPVTKDKKSRRIALRPGFSKVVLDALPADGSWVDILHVIAVTYDSLSDDQAAEAYYRQYQSSLEENEYEAPREVPVMKRVHLGRRWYVSRRLSQLARVGKVEVSGGRGMTRRFRRVVSPTPTLGNHPSGAEADPSKTSTPAANNPPLTILSYGDPTMTDSTQQATDILAKLRKSGFTIATMHGQPIIDPQSDLTPDQRKEVRACKKELVALLEAEKAAEAQDEDEDDDEDEDEDCESIFGHDNEDGDDGTRTPIFHSEDDDDDDPFGDDDPPLTILPLFRDYFRPLIETERNALREKLKKDGCTEKLHAWRRPDKRILIDGHNRRDLCEELGITYAIHDNAFENEAEALAWVEQHAFGRRNLGRLERRYYLGTKYNRAKAKQGGTGANQHTTEQTPQNKVSATAVRLATEEKVSRATVQRAGQFAALVDRLDAHLGTDRRVKWLILTDQMEVTPDVVAALTSISSEAAWSAIQKARGADGDHESTLSAATLLQHLQAAGRITPAALKESKPKPADNPPTKPTATTPADAAAKPTATLASPPPLPPRPAAPAAAVPPPATTPGTPPTAGHSQSVPAPIPPRMSPAAATTPKPAVAGQMPATDQPKPTAPTAAQPKAPVDVCNDIFDSPPAAPPKPAAVQSAAPVPAAVAPTSTLSSAATAKPETMADIFGDDDEPASGDVVATCEDDDEDEEDEMDKEEEDRDLFDDDQDDDEDDEDDCPPRGPLDYLPGTPHDGEWWTVTVANLKVDDWLDVLRKMIRTKIEAEDFADEAYLASIDADIDAGLKLLKDAMMNELTSQNNDPDDIF